MNITTYWKKAIVYICLFFSIHISLYAAPIKIMPLGDSITEGISRIPAKPESNLSTYPNITTGVPNLSKQADRIGYRGKLWDLLKEAGHSVDFVGTNSAGSSYKSTGFDTDHEGYGGIDTYVLLNGKKDEFNQTRGGMDRILQKNRPDIVLLHIGTNDVSGDEKKSVENVKKILDKIFKTNPKSKVFLAKIININAKDETKWVKRYNTQLENMAKKHKKKENIVIVDMFNALTYGKAGGTNDMQPYHADRNNAPDYHPTSYGYEKMANKWFDMMVGSGVFGTGIPPVTDTNQSIIKTIKVGGSVLRAEGLNVKESPGRLTHSFTNNSAYISATQEGRVSTGFNISGKQDATLKKGTHFKKGTTSTIKKKGTNIVIHTKAKYNKNDTFEIGGL
ncbi:MAG: GDSL-type esterase/lipase family protein [Sulfurovum sp.]|nr:GDSL-type esterase/lipase family protein [Sulfurovum sp.]